jgi:adenylate cyclase
LISKIRPDDAEMLPATADQLVERRPLQAASLAIRSLVRSEPRLTDFLHASLEGRNSAEVPARHRTELIALASLFSGDAVRYLNFYGPPGTFRSVSYADVLKDGRALEDVRGKIAIIGYADFTPAQRDDHYSTVYTTSDGVKLSGIELLATAVANLQTRTSLVAPAPAVRATVAIAFGAALALLLLMMSPAKGLAATAGLCAAYLSIAVVLFRASGLWLPVLIPLLIQTPTGILYAIAHHYRDMRRKRDELRLTFGKFVPDQVIDTLLQKRAELDAVTEPVYGVCLATDAERFSTLAESMHPGQLARLLNRYFEAVFPPITKREGVISDIIGDMVLAFWTGIDPNPVMHAKACSAALELKTAVDEFNAASAGGRLPTRIGISAGPVTTSAIGAFDRFEFRPIGDTVVTSARLQELSKMLGTRILATEPVVHGLDIFLVRDVGTFLLRGKKQPSHVYELLGERNTASAALLQLCLEFALALDALRAGGRENALARFRAIRDRYPQDGPTIFYVQWLSSHRTWNGDAIPQP